MQPRVFFQNLKMQRKLLLITLTICAAVILIVVASLFSFQILAFRTTFKRDTATLAAVIANNSTAALAFGDRKAAQEIVGSLRVKSNVRRAFLCNSQGGIVAHFGTIDGHDSLALFPGPRDFRFHDGDLLYTEMVSVDGQSLGKLCVQLDYRAGLLELVRFYGFIIIVVLLVSGLLALWLSTRLGKLITTPLWELAETARQVGQANDYSVRSRVADRKDELGVLASAFNHMLQRIQSQDVTISLSQQKLESLVNSINGIVWEWAPDRQEFTFVSRQAKQILGYESEAWMDNSKLWKQMVHPDDLPTILNSRQRALVERQPYHCEYRMIAADERELWVRESGVVLIEDGKPGIVRGIFQDITHQKLAEEELEKLNRRLIDTSRQAGMAEVATGVLHNVGNVLNSVNVSAELLNEGIANSRLGVLKQASTMIRDHLPTLATFLQNDPKGQLLPQFIIKVTEVLSFEHDSWRKELESLTKNIGHVKQIVAMQQNYARISGVTETIEAKEVVEDALQINSAGLHRHGVDVIRNFEEGARITVDKHKVMQILINLIRNAKYALQENQPSQKQLTLSISSSSNDRVKIVVQDNGVGIPKENLTRIFGHGFTTKSDGHGFGLHSGALAAKELGGSLAVHSDGLGQGAAFTLELPAAKRSVS